MFSCFPNCPPLSSGAKTSLLSKCTSFDKETGLVDKKVDLSDCYSVPETTSIGKGAYGHVVPVTPRYPVTGISYPKEVLLKLSTGNEGSDESSLKNEAKIYAKLSKLNYPFFPRYLGTFTAPWNIYSFLRGGILSNFLALERILPIWEDLIENMDSARKDTLNKSLEKNWRIGINARESRKWNDEKKRSGLDGIFNSKRLKISQFPLTNPDDSVFLKMVFYQILEAIDTMHQNNMLHLDVKPDNIMLRKRVSSDGSPLPIQARELDKPPNFDVALLDFGGAWELPTTSSSKPTNWQSGGNWKPPGLGTSHYKCDNDIRVKTPGMDKRTIDSFSMAMTICDVLKGHGEGDVRSRIDHKPDRDKWGPDFQYLVMPVAVEETKKWVEEIRQNLRKYTKDFPPGLGDLVEKMILQDDETLGEIKVNLKSPDKIGHLPAHRLLPKDALNHEYFKIGPYPVCPTGKVGEQNHEWDCVCHSPPKPDSNPDDFWKNQSLVESDANPSGHYHLVNVGNPYPADCLWGEVHSEAFKSNGGGPAFRDYQKFYVDRLKEKVESDSQTKTVKTASSFMQISQDFLEGGNKASDTNHFLAPSVGHASVGHAGLIEFAGLI